MAGRAALASRRHPVRAARGFPADDLARRIRVSHVPEADTRATSGLDRGAPAASSLTRPRADGAGAGVRRPRNPASRSMSSRLVLVRGSSRFGAYAKSVAAVVGSGRTSECRMLAAENREVLRVRYQPKRVKILFVGESPPGSGNFFYLATGPLFRSTRQAFVEAGPPWEPASADRFLEHFRNRECYLEDLCEKAGTKVDCTGRDVRSKYALRGRGAEGDRAGVARPCTSFSSLAVAAESVPKGAHGFPKARPVKFHADLVLLPLVRKAAGAGSGRASQRDEADARRDGLSDTAGRVMCHIGAEVWLCRF